VEQYLQKGGKVEDTIGRKCLCNGLVANIGFPQVQKSGYVEKVLVTSGNEIQHIAELVKSGEDSYCATAVIDYLIGSHQAN
jgi:nitronate monooxygenase